jgi:hypothetical protein
MEMGGKNLDLLEVWNSHLATIHVKERSKLSSIIFASEQTLLGFDSPPRKHTVRNFAPSISF